jgi:cytokinin dehydrogenase
MASRREVLRTLGATAVLGFSPITRSWIGAGAAKASSPFEDVPSLDGELLLPPADLTAYETDAGNIIYRTPVAVLKPASTRDIQKMIRFCRRHSIYVSARGQGHTTGGQGLVSGGLIIDMGTLDQIYSINRDSADVGAGLKWNELVQTTVARGLTPPVLTGYLGLSIGGTLSVGGISSTNGEGAQVDRVRELEVVTGEGEIRRCSMWRDRDLFEAALAGLGQCGIITRATVDLVPAPAMARTYVLEYTDNATFFEDFRTLLDRGEFNDVFNMWFPDGNGGWLYQLNAVKFFDPRRPPNDARLLRGLNRPASEAVATDSPYLNYVMRVDVVIDFFRQIGLWDNVAHPWFDVFLPDHSVERYVDEVIPSLTPEDVGPAGFLLLFPLKRCTTSRPFFRVPHGGDWVFLFDILTSGPGPGNDPAFNQRMLQRNRTLYDKAQRQGGTRYPIGSLDFEKKDWRNQYGSQWNDFQRSKQRFDPDGILTPGPGIFR